MSMMEGLQYAPGKLQVGGAAEDLWAGAGNPNKYLDKLP